MKKHPASYGHLPFGLSFAFILITVMISFECPGYYRETSIPNSSVHQFITETGRLYHNDLATDGTYLYGTRYDGGVNGNGYIYKIKTDSTGYEIMYYFEQEVNGYNPVGALVLSGSWLYGMTIFGGAENMGVIFRITTGGTGYEKLMDFNGQNGALPYCSLIIQDSVIYGISQQGGNHSYGLVFKLNLNGTGFKDLLDFDGTNGWAPAGSLTLSGTRLYGVTVRGGVNDLGVIYRIDTSGNNYLKLHDFDGTSGSQPFGGMTRVGTTLYGTTGQGGSSFCGVLFKIDTSGSDYSVVNNFGISEGSDPEGDLVLFDSTLYGMTVNGGYGDGIIYRVGLDGNQFETLWRFDKLNGMNPMGSLTLHDSVFYGIVHGGEFNYGALFRIGPDGTGFTKLKDFTASNSGYNALSSLLITPAGNFGMTKDGGVYNKGTVYKMNPDGTDFRIILNFNGINGANPVSSLIYSDSVLYGMTEMGGSEGAGVLFKLNTDSTGYEKLIDFTSVIGYFPAGSPVASGDLLYGMTSGGGPDNKGLIFSFNKISQDYEILFDFSGTDAVQPTGSILLNDSVLYGMCLGGVHDGVVFSVNTNGSGFTKIIDSDGNNAGRYGCSITIANSVLYGVTRSGGPADNGVLFRSNLDGSDLQTLHLFNWGSGIIPVGSLVVQDSMIFGLTEIGGPDNSGVAYSIGTDGSGYSIFVNYSNPEMVFSGRMQSSGNSAHVQGSMSSSENSLYITASIEDNGMNNSRIFKYDFYPDEPAKNVGQTNTQNQSMTLTWDRGNGTYCLVLMKEGTSEPVSPVTGFTYAPESVFGNGSQINQSGWYCIYNGTGSACGVTGLNRNTQYTVVVYEYNRLTGSPRYLVMESSGNPAVLSTTNLDTPPVVQASALVFSDIATDQLTVSWTRGDGAHCALFVKEESSGEVVPEDGINYADSDRFGSGDQVGSSGWYCVYNGEGSEANIFGLEENTSYRFMVSEYNIGSEGPIYLTASAAGNPESCATTVTSLAKPAEMEIRFYPNPAHDRLMIPGAGSTSVQVCDIRGSRIMNMQTDKGSLDVSRLAPGLYLLSIDNRRYKFIKE